MQLDRLDRIHQLLHQLIRAAYCLRYDTSHEAWMRWVMIYDRLREELGVTGRDGKEQS